MDIPAAISSNPLWYHTIELAPGQVTPGWFDARPVVEKMPWPDVKGKRCLDVGTYDGFFAFEMEKRGAAEVVATDISGHEHWDWPMDVRAQGPERLAEIAGPQKGLGFQIAKEALNSNVEKVEINIYDLTPEKMGTFDVIVCGSLMLHLRDPLRAMWAVRSVCAGHFLSAETIDLLLTIEHPNRPVSVLNGVGSNLHWTIPNAAGHRQMLRASGFKVERFSKPYTIPYGPAHVERKISTVKSAGKVALQYAMGGRPGVPHAAVLARAI